MDDATARELRLELLSVAKNTKAALVRKLGPRLFPAMKKVPDQTLAVETNRLWDQSVAIPLDPVPLQIPRKLPGPKPDLVFGYSQAAFDWNQQMAIELLVKELDKSYAMPAVDLTFLILQAEFEGWATDSTLYAAENQAASAGAIAMNGLLELYRHISAEADIDMDIPQYFSLTMGQRFASVNVHWLSRSAENGPISFHVGLISDYVLTDSNSLRAIHQTVKNILDYGVRKRLPRICAALDRCKQKFVLERETAMRRRDSDCGGAADTATVIERSSDQPGEEWSARLGRILQRAV